MKLGSTGKTKEAEEAEFVEFSAQTRMSGINLADGRAIRKGAYDSIIKE